MKALVRLHVWWPTLDSDIEQVVRNCKVCLTTHSKAPLTLDNPWFWPYRPWQRVHIDYCGPLYGEMFLVLADAESKWLEVLRMSSTTTEAAVQALRFVFATHGLPEEIMLSYRTTPHTATGCTPAELLMNRRLRIRLDPLLPDLKKKVAKPDIVQQNTPKRQLTVGDPVLVQDYRKIRDPWTKGVIVSKLGPVTYRVQVEDFFWKRHTDQLKDLSGTKI